MDPLSIAAAAREAPDRVALIADGRRWSFGELAEQVAFARGGLARHRIGRGGRVALRATNRFETVVTVLALIEDGVPFVPLHPRLTPSESAALVADSEAAAVLSDDDLRTLLNSGRATAPSRTPLEGELLAMLYTSGTTGKAKGALLQRSAFIAAAHASEQNLGWGEDDRWLLCMPVCHVGGLSILTRCLMARRCVVLLPKFDSQAVLESIQSHGVTMLSVVPTMLVALLDADRDNVLARLRVVLVGGAAAPFPLLEESARRGIPALTTYGLTEACSQVTVQRLRRPPAAAQGSGIALPGTEVSILDDAGRTAPAGEVGRIHVRGPTLMQGYWKQPPLLGSFDTGDLGSLDSEGCLHVAARRTDLIVTGGENVYPAEVEQVLLAAPGVKEALVFGTSDDRWGQVVSAAIVLAPSGDAAAVRRCVEAQLASHKRPRLVCFVEALPVTAGGKPDRLAAGGRFRGVLEAW